MSAAELDDCQGCERDTSECPYSGIEIDSYREGDEIVQVQIDPKRDGCPWDLVTPFAWVIADMYSHYGNGYLFYSNVLGHNPAWYVKAMRFMSGKFSEVTNKKLRLRKQKADGQEINRAGH